LECDGDILVVDFAGSEVRLTNWQFLNKGYGTAKQILTYVEDAVRDGKLISVRVASVVNFRFADHLHRRGWHRMEHNAGCAPDYVISSETKLWQTGLQRVAQIHTSKM